MIPPSKPRDWRADCRLARTAPVVSDCQFGGQRRQAELMQGRKLSGEIWINQGCDRSNVIGIHQHGHVSVAKIDEDI